MSPSVSAYSFTGDDFQICHTADSSTGQLDTVAPVDSIMLLTVRGALDAFRAIGGDILCARRHGKSEHYLACQLHGFNISQCASLSGNGSQQSRSGFIQTCSKKKSGDESLFPSCDFSFLAKLTSFFLTKAQPKWPNQAPSVRRAMFIAMIGRDVRPPLRGPCPSVYQADNKAGSISENTGPSYGGRSVSPHAL